jgi:hypothetical protein
MTKISSNVSAVAGSAPRGALARMRESAFFLKALNALLKTPVGQSIVKLCRDNRSYIPLSPEVPRGASFSDGHSASSQTVQVIAVTGRGLMVLSSYSLPERLPNDCLGFPILGRVPGLRALQVAMAIPPAREQGFDLQMAQQQLQKAYELANSGKSAQELRLMIPRRA